MQSQVIICDQQTLYALGCGALINEHPQFNGYRIIRNLQMLNEMMSEDHPSYDFPKFNMPLSSTSTFGKS